MCKDRTELDGITTLLSGVRIASEALEGAFFGVGVYIDAGPWDENEHLRSASHIMGHLDIEVWRRRLASACRWLGRADGPLLSAPGRNR